MAARVTLAIRGTYLLQDMVNVHNWYTDTADLYDLANGWVDNCAGKYTTCLSTLYTGIEVVATNRFTHEQYTLEWTGAGAISGQGLPPQVAAIISWKTGLAGRKYRGRTFIPAQTELDNESGTLSSQQIAALEDYAGTLLTWSQNYGGLVVYHADGVPASTAIVSYVVRNHYGVQRRRAIGRGS